MKKLTIFFIVICMALGVVNLLDEGSQLNKIESVEQWAVNTYSLLARRACKDVVYGASEEKDVYRLSLNAAATADIDGRMDGLYAGTGEMKELALETGADFLMVIVPYKQYFYQDIEGFPDNTKRKYELARDYLDQTGTDCIDVAQCFPIPECDPVSFYYKSDHHWNNDGAFIVFAEIADYLEEKGYSVDNKFLLHESYEVKNYEDSHLGSAGRFAGKYFGEHDDVNLYLPVAETALKVTLPSSGEVFEGTFEDTLVHYENLEGLNFDKYGYYSYFGTDTDYIEVENPSSEGPHIVVIKDSMAVPVNAFLSLVSSEIDIVDLRYVEDDGAGEYIKNKQPDVIIGLFGTGSLGEIGTMTP